MHTATRGAPWNRPSALPAAKLRRHGRDSLPDTHDRRPRTISVPPHRSSSSRTPPPPRPDRPIPSNDWGPRYPSTECGSRSSVPRHLRQQVTDLAPRRRTGNATRRPAFSVNLPLLDWSFNDRFTYPGQTTADGAACNPGARKPPAIRRSHDVPPPTGIPHQLRRQRLLLIEIQPSVADLFSPCSRTCSGSRGSRASLPPKQHDDWPPERMMLFRLPVGRIPEGVHDAPSSSRNSPKRLLGDSSRFPKTSEKHSDQARHPQPTGSPRGSA